jgi:EAL domain-containing protein (putative c-di-GMP-specific phosphodiesterase class I)
MSTITRREALGLMAATGIASCAAVGCDLAQGYLISKPEPLATLVDEGLIVG